MRSRRMAFLARWPVAVTLAAAGTFVVGMSFTSPAAMAAQPSPSPSASPQPSPSSSATEAATKVAAARGLACTEMPNGHLRDCPKPVAKSAQPAGSRDSSTMSSMPADLATFVDTRTWSSGGGNTFPGADVPFGMVQWSPDTSPDRSDGGGYNYGDTSLIGYSLTHLSGPGCSAGGDVPILPMTGALPSGNPNSVLTSFTNTGEVAQAGYYSADSNLPDTITSQFTATSHASMGKFTFPETTSADFLIKLQDSENEDFADSAQIVGDNEVMGSDTSGDFCGEPDNGGQLQQYTVYFDIIFSQPFTASQVITQAGATDPAAVFLTFNTTSDPVIDAKVAISYVSTANAQLNRETNIPGWDFAKVKASAQATWNKLLGEIQVSGGSYAQTQEFYSLLYKDFLQPNIVSDVNGQFMGSDMQVHTLAPGQKNQYGIYSGWDIYHSLSELQAVLDPPAASDQAQSLVNYYSENGILQQWGYLNLDNYVMVGDPAQSIISDYYAFGARHFNTKQALADMLKQATTVNDVRPGEALEQEYGYLPANGTYGCCNAHGMAATLLEYDTADLALSQFASDLGDTKDATMLEERANNWENMFDPYNDLLNPKNENGQLIPGITPTFNDSSELYYVEGDPAEYVFDTPNDYSALISLMGGDSKVIPELANYWSQPNGYGEYGEISNEFDLGEQNAADYAGDPAGAQLAINTIDNTVYLPGPDGLDNNDDLGAESSQFIWEMLGMYPENSGSDNLLLNGPGFPRESIHLPSGKTISISAPGASPTEFYVQGLSINGRADSQLSIPFSTLAQGATMDWTMGTKPSSWGSAPSDAPPSYTAGLRPVVGYTSSQQVDVAPGGSTTVQVEAQDATGTAQTVHTSVSVPSGSGLTVTPSSGTLRVPADGRGSVTVTVTASSSAAQTFSTVPVALTDGPTAIPAVNLTVLVAEPGSLARTFNNEGISSNSDVLAANFDGSGNSYSEQALAAAGLTAGQTVTVDGTQFTWPLSAPGYPDNTMTDGQQVTVNAPAGTQTLGFLGAATDGPSQGLATLTYSDGTTQQYWLGLSDWTLDGGTATPSYGNQVAASTTYRNCASCSSGESTTGTNVFYTSLPVDPDKTLTSVTLPSDVTQGTLNIFAIGTSTQALSPPVAASVSPATASAGQQVTIDGSGFGATQGNSYVELNENGVDWGPPNALGTSQTGELAWSGPDNDGCSANTGGLASVDSGSGEQWTASCVTDQTWIQDTPSGLVPGQTYTASVTLEANSSQQTAPMYLDFYNGCVDTSSAVVSLTPGTPVTLTNTTTIGCSNAPQFQVRTDGPGSVDLTVTNASIAGQGTVQVDSWSNTAITFTVPAFPTNILTVYPGSEAMVTVEVASSAGTDSPSDTLALDMPHSGPQTGTLGWSGPLSTMGFCSTNTGGLASVNSGSGEQWTASCVTNQTWIQVTPVALGSGQMYTASVTLEANSTQQTAPMYLDFYNGCADTSSAVVSLTPGTPVTLTDTTTIGCSNSPQFQVRTNGPGGVDLTVTNANISAG